MTEREILIANTRTQKKSKLMTSATTLGELKVAMREAGIEYGDLTFTEGITKTQLLDDASPLPQNVMYKGQPTNNLVMLLTNTKNKIDSGCGTRQEAYAIIKENNFMQGIQEKYGYNYTNVSTEDLWDYINNNLNDDLDDEEDEVEASPIVDYIGGIVDELLDKGAFSMDDVEALRDHLTEILEDTEQEFIESSDGTITNEDINNMMASI